ncbi:hypothetical protein Tco_0049289 [Tanacetum coccineum]
MVPHDFFFNRDLEYLMDANNEKKYATSLTKYYVATYEQEGIEKIIPDLWTYGIAKYDRDASLGIHHWNDHRQWFFKGEIGAKSDNETRKDKEKSKTMVHKIEKTLKERRQLWRLKSYVGERRKENDISLLVRPD